MSRPAMTTDGTLNEEAQKKALEVVLDLLGMTDYPLDTVFNNALAKKVNSALKRKSPPAKA